MTAQCIFRSQHLDIRALVSRVDELQPGDVPSAHVHPDWDSFTADFAAAHFVGDVLRWYERLDTAVQQSWSNLRARLLSMSGAAPEDSSEEDGADSQRKKSCLVAEPAPPPLLRSTPRTDRGTDDISDGYLQTTLISDGVGAHTRIKEKHATIKPNIMQRLSLASHLVPQKPQLPQHYSPQKPSVSHLIIDLVKSTPLSQRYGWNPIEISIPAPSGSVGVSLSTLTYEIAQPIPLSSDILSYIRVGFRLTEPLAQYERIHVKLYRTGPGKSRSYTASEVASVWPDPVLGPPRTAFVLFDTNMTLSPARQNPNGMSVKTSLFASDKTSWFVEPPKVVVEWKIQRSDVVTLVQRLDRLQPGDVPSAHIFPDWDSWIADFAAAHFVGDALRWYEGLDAAAQHSWSTLRIKLLSVSGEGEGNPSNDETDGSMKSSLAAQPVPPPISQFMFRANPIHNYGSDDELRTGTSSDRKGAKGHVYSTKAKTTIMQKLSGGSRLSRQPSTLPQYTLPASHMIIDLATSAPSHYRSGWNPIEIELPASSEATAPTYKVTPAIPLQPEIVTFLRIGFRLIEPLPEGEQMFMQIRRMSKPNRHTSSQVAFFWPDPVFGNLGAGFVPFESRPMVSFRRQEVNGMEIRTGLWISDKHISWHKDPPNLVVEWKIGDLV